MVKLLMLLVLDIPALLDGQIYEVRRTRVVEGRIMQEELSRAMLNARVENNDLLKFPVIHNRKGLK